MSAEYAVVLADRFTSAADKIGDSADKAHAKIVAMQNAAKQGVKLGAFLLGGGSGAGRSGGGRAAYNEAADGWSKARAAAEKANRSLGLAQSAAIAMDQRRTAITERNRERVAAAAARAQQKETASLAREEAKRNAITDRAARIRAAAHEKASHKSYYGGHKSISGLFGARAEHKTSGLVTGAADAILAAPSSAISSAADAITALVTGSATIAYNFGKATIAAQSMREESVEGFKAIYGIGVDADKLFDDARTIAKQTKFETPQVVAQFNTLAAAGFSADQLKRMYLTTADVGSARGTGKQAQYTRGLSKLNAQDAAMFGTFQQAAMAGPGLKNAEQTLAKQLGINFTPKGGLDEHLRKMFRDHKIKGSTALEGVVGATNSLYNKNTGKEGEFAYAQGSKTWAGMISNIKAGLGDILNMKMDDQKGLAGFKTLLQSIGSDNGLFDQASERGQRFASLVSRFVEDIFMPFGGITLNKTGSILDRIIDAGTELELKFRVIMIEISKGFDSFLSDAKGSILGLATDIGSAIAKGMYQGAIEMAFGPQGTRYSSVAQGSSGKAWGNLFEDITGSRGPNDTGQGATSAKTGQIPTFALGGIVPGPTGSRQAIYAHGGEVVSGLHGEYGGRSRGGGSTYEVTINVMVQGTQDPVATAQRAAAEFEMAADRYFGRLLAQG